MTLVNLPEVPNNPSTEQLAQIVGAIVQELMYTLNGFVSSDNSREFGGWQVGKTELQSKDKTVGMSTNKVGADPIRFFAGDVITGSPKFKVTESGIASMVSAIISSVLSGERVVIDETGLHCYDAFNVERLTIGTTVTKGVKAITGRDASGAAQSVYTYDTENVDGADLTGQYITAHGAYILIDSSGNIRMQCDPTSNGEGFRARKGNRPEANGGSGWNAIAYKSEVDALAARVFALEHPTP